jgi:GxxExxY protein
MIIADAVIIEVKSVSKIIPLHIAQMLTYLKLTKLRLGLIINFNIEVLHLGVRRVISG